MSQQLILDSKIYSLLKRAREEIKNKNWEQAAIISSEAVDSDPTNVPAIIVLSDLQLQRGLFEAAIHTLLSVRDKNPNNFQITTLLIQVHLKAFKLDESQKLLVEASQTKYINNPEYYALYGQFFELKQNIVFAVKYYEESLKRNPLDDKLLFKLANIYYKNKQFADAKKKLTSALFLDPKNTEYLSLYAMILNEQDGSDVAIGYVRDLMVDIGEDPKLLSTITSIYFKSGQVNEFKNYYKKIQQLPKKDEGFYEFLISAAKLEESYEDFENYSKELIKINPGNLKTRMNLAEFYIDKKRFPEAINELQDIKDKLPSYPKVHFMLAKVYLAQGDMKNAKDMATLELKLNPSLDSAYFIMGEVYRQNKEYREAVANFEKAISKNGKSLESIMALAWVRLNQNLASEALDLYTRAVKLDPINPEVHKQLGYTYKALGQRAVAKENFENYLKLNPAASDKPQIDQIIRSLK
jgi:tetratricopeptide (TPR) repeat protein